MSIFREYIGVKPYPDTLHDFPGYIINPKIHEFHFILGFATEAYDQHRQGTGQFTPDWNVHYFSPENVRRLKENHPNVKVVLSIGGRGPEHPFNPAERETWVENAIESLENIIDEYKFDGIDINYEHIHSDDFVDCMGKVIVELKKQVHVVSIAPSDRVASCYMTLYQAHNAHINWVDYQFYNQPVSSVDEFVNLYRQLSNDFDASKLLPGVSTDPADAANMSREVFIGGIGELIRTALIFPGAFVWNANDSVAPPPAQ